MQHLLLLSLFSSIVINAVMFLVAYARQSDKLTDISYAISFLVLAGLGFWNSAGQPYHIALLGSIALWASRLGGFLLNRVLRTDKDRRFDGMRAHFIQFGRFWLGQAITVWILMLPASLAFSVHGSVSGVALTGLGVFLLGLTMESVADQQKYRFKQTSHSNEWIDTGLWHYARHPNYCGEMLVWIGIYLYAVPALSPIGRLIGFVSPLCIIVLLRFVSGVPILERSAEQRWGSDPAYQQYRRRTRLLVPLPKHR